MAAKEEKKALIAETKIEEDTFAFEEFLKENDRSSVNALKMLDFVPFYYKGGQLSLSAVAHTLRSFTEFHRVLFSPSFSSCVPTQSMDITYIFPCWWSGVNGSTFPLIFWEEMYLNCT